jgi:GH25 family lysozyme M1 (1,4-beta-N-acetylmuramidase)
MIEGIDVSHHQVPQSFDWPALAKRVKFVVARAAYGKMADKTFAKYAELCRQHGIAFGGYLFYRQTQSTRDQLLLFQRQIELAGGIDVLPVLDMEENASNGDGRPIAATFSSACAEIAYALKADYGGAILYYSSYFPEYLGKPQQPAISAWMRDDFKHWLADYNRPPGKPRNPYTAEWHIHQPQKTRIPEYAKGTADLDLNVVNPKMEHGWRDTLLCKASRDLSPEAIEGEQGTTERPGGALPSDHDCLEEP